MDIYENDLQIFNPQRSPATPAGKYVKIVSLNIHLAPHNVLICF